MPCFEGETDGREELAWRERSPAGQQSYMGRLVEKDLFARESRAPVTGTATAHQVPRACCWGYAYYSGPARRSQETGVRGPTTPPRSPATRRRTSLPSVRARPRASPVKTALNQDVLGLARSQVDRMQRLRAGARQDTVGSRERPRSPPARLASFSTNRLTASARGHRVFPSTASKRQRQTRQKSGREATGPRLLRDAEPDATKDPKTAELPKGQLGSFVSHRLPLTGASVLRAPQSRVRCRTR